MVPPARSLPRLRLLVLLALAVAAAVPLANAQAPAQDAPMAERATSLYLHLSGVQDAPMTTQAPPDAYTGDFAYGLATASLTCLPQLPATGVQQEYHTQRAFGSLNPIDYLAEEPREVLGAYGASRGGPRLDVALSGDRLLLQWYLSTDVEGTDGLGGAVPFVLPGVVVEATLRAGDSISVDDSTYDGGDLLAYGRSEAALLAGDQSTGVTFTESNGRRVYAFEIPLELAVDVLPADTGYNLRIDTYVLGDDCPEDGYLTPNLLAAHTSVGHRPRIELVGQDAPVLDNLHAFPYRDDRQELMILVSNVTSPWGNHDIAKVDLAIRSLDGERSAGLVLPVPLLGETTHCHCPPTPVQAIWAWDHAAEDAPPGEYVATVTAVTLQGETATATFTFTVPGDRASPAAGPAALLLGLAAGALALARRRP